MSSVAFKEAAFARGFTQVPNDVLIDKRLSVQARMTWMLLAKYAWQRSTAFPSQETLGSLLGVGERSVRGYVTELVKAGWIETRRRGLGKTNEYLLVVPELELRSGPEADFRSDRQLVADEEDTEKKTQESSPQKAPRQEHGEFGEWMGDHAEVTGHAVMRAGTRARAHVAAMFAARREEGYSLDELKLATRGAFADDFRRENGHIGPESILRPTKVAGLIEKGRRAEAPKMLRDPLTGMEFAAGTYS